MFHFLQLVGGYAGLESEQVFGVNTVSLIEDLTPAVFAGCLCSEEGQVLCWKEEVVVVCATREKEIRPFLIFCNSLLIETEFGCCENVGQMMLQRFSETGFAAVKERVGSIGEVLDRVKRRGVHRAVEDVLELIEQIAFCLDPIPEDSVRVAQYLALSDAEDIVVDLAGQT